jgi:hypothetical protein
MAEPKNTGVCRPARYSAGSKRWLAPQRRVVNADYHLRILLDVVAPRLVQKHRIVGNVVHPLEPSSHANRPGHRRALDAEHRFNLIQQFDRLAAFAVQLVDKGENGRLAQAADFHQLDGALLDALGAVNDHQGRVHGGQRAVGVFRKVRVAGRIQQVDDAAIVLELHHRAGDRDAALLLQLHPVGGRVPRGFAGLDRSGHVNGAAEQQEFLGQGGLAGVGMRNNRKRAAAADLSVEF